MVNDPPTENDDISSKKYTDTKLVSSGWKMTGHININFYNFKNVAALYDVYGGISKMVLEETSKQIYQNHASVSYIRSYVTRTKKKSYIQMAV